MLCSRCNIDQPRDQFGPSADMWPQHRQCKRCNRHKAQIRKHGLSSAEKTEIATAQGGCRICGHPEPSNKGWVLDHDRSCCPGDASCQNCRRGVICQWCNTALGNAFDRPSTLRAAADYIEAHRAARTCDWHKPVACSQRLCGQLMDLLTHAEDEQTQIQSPTSDHSSFVPRAGGTKIDQF